MMKRIVIIWSFIITGALAAACSRVSPEDEQDRISFSTAVGPVSTKSESAYAGADFGSYAWKTSGTWESTADAQKLSNPYMMNVQTSKGSDDKWYPGAFCWPSESAYLHFACYAPYKASSPMTYSVTDGISVSGYKIDYPGTGEDLLYSDLSKNNNNTKAACPIIFHHALCQVVVKLKTDAIPSGLTSVVSSTSVTLKSLSLSKLKNSGDFKQNSTPKWSGQSGSASYTIFSGTKVLTTTSDESCAALYVIPQAFEAGIQTISLTYDVSMTYSDSSTKNKNGITESHCFNDLSLSEWEPGKQIIYSITVSAFGDPISFSATTENWTEQSVDGNLGGSMVF